MGDARGPPPRSLLLKAPPIGAPGQRREGEGEREMERGEGQTKGFRRCEETHTSLCFHLSA